MWNSCNVTLTMVIVGLATVTAQAAEKKVPLIFDGGHETDRRDGGRPIVLIAAALEVPPEVFRKAFSGVTPARNGRPSPEDARKNKAALMSVLKPHGVTNDRLDEVSNYYRYQPQRGDLWKNSAAKGHAVVENGKVKEIVITEAGSGYSTPPTATVEGMEKIKLKVSIQFDKDFKKNGSISAIEVVSSTGKNGK